MLGPLNLATPSQPPAIQHLQDRHTILHRAIAAVTAAVQEQQTRSLRRQQQTDRDCLRISLTSHIKQTKLLPIHLDKPRLQGHEVLLYPAEEELVYPRQQREAVQSEATLISLVELEMRRRWEQGKIIILTFHHEVQVAEMVRRLQEVHTHRRNSSFLNLVLEDSRLTMPLVWLRYRLRLLEQALDQSVQAGQIQPFHPPRATDHNLHVRDRVIEMHCPQHCTRA